AARVPRRACGADRRPFIHAQGCDRAGKDALDDRARIALSIPAGLRAVRPDRSRHARMAVDSRRAERQSSGPARARPRWIHDGLTVAELTENLRMPHSLVMALFQDASSAAAAARELRALGI